MQHRYIRRTLHIAVEIKSVVEVLNVLARTFRDLVENIDGANIAQALATISHRLSHLQLHMVLIGGSTNVRDSGIGEGTCAQDTCHQKGSDFGNENTIG